MLSYEKNVRLILSFFFKDIHIINHIINIHNQLIFNDTKESYIEKDFYNWLTYDIQLRRELMVQKNNFRIMVDMNQLNYYNNNKELGLDNEYRRVKSLNKCFHSKWWKHTEKNNIEWNKIHKILRSKIIVLYPTTTEYYLNDKGWYRPSIVKSKIVINDFYINDIYRKNRILLEDISYIYTDIESFPIMIE